MYNNWRYHLFDYYPKIMKYGITTVIAILSFISISAPALADSVVGGDCTFKGKRLSGNVQFVDNSFADIKIQIVDSFPDLNVQKVDSLPDACGKWREVDSSPDFTVQIVDSFPDLKVKYVDSFPGVP